MQIKCPECGFSREVNKSQIPAGSSFATCPKCSVRFRFRAEPDLVDLETPGAGEPREEHTQSGEPKEGDIWASMDKMRRDWDEIDREDQEQARPPSEENARPGAAGEPDYHADDEARRREEADRAYRQTAGQGGKIPFLSTVGSVPWEYRGGFMNPLVFLRTVILMVTRAPQFFSGINPYSSIFPAWVFLLVARGVQMVTAIVGTRLVSTLPDGSQQILPMHEVFNMPMLIFVSMCMITLMHFLGSFIVNYTIQTLARSKADFRLTFKVMAYANMPIMLSVIPGVGSMLGLLGSLALLFVGTRYAYGFSWRKTAVSVLPYLILSVLFLMMILQAATSQGG